MKQRLSIILVFVLLATVNVILKFQLQCARMELRSVTGVMDELRFAVDHSYIRAARTRQKIFGPETNLNSPPANR
jgi:hypothetical protein